jgi:hypothetical protein
MLHQPGRLSAVASATEPRISDAKLDDWYKRWPGILPTSVPHEQVRMLIEDIRDARDQLRMWGDMAEANQKLRENCAIDVAAVQGVLAMAVQRLGGTVEGQPTSRVNFLQRIDELREIERAHKERGRS